MISFNLNIGRFSVEDILILKVWIVAVTLGLAITWLTLRRIVDHVDIVLHRTEELQNELYKEANDLHDRMDRLL